MKSITVVNKDDYTKDEIEFMISTKGEKDALIFMDNFIEILGSYLEKDEVEKVLWKLKTCQWQKGTPQENLQETPQVITNGD